VILMKKQPTLTNAVDTLQELYRNAPEKEFEPALKSMLAFVSIGQYLKSNNINVTSAVQKKVFDGDMCGGEYLPMGSIDVFDREYSIVDKILQSEELKKYNFSIISAESRHKDFTGIGGCHWHSLSSLFDDYKRKIPIFGDAYVEDFLSTITLKGTDRATSAEIYIDVNPPIKPKQSCYEQMKEKYNPTFVDLTSLIIQTKK